MTEYDSFPILFWIPPEQGFYTKTYFFRLAAHCARSSKCEAGRRMAGPWLPLACVDSAVKPVHDWMSCLTPPPTFILLSSL